MKLSKRERILLIALAGIAFITAFYFLLLAPQMETLKEVRAQQDTVRVEYQHFQEMMNPAHPIYNTYKEMDNRVKNLAAPYFPELIQEKIITILDGYFTAAGIQPESIAFDDKAVAQVPDAESGEPIKADILAELKAQYEGADSPKASDKGTEIPVQPEAEAPAPTQENEVTPLDSITQMGVNITFSGTYGNITKFIKALEADKRRIMVNAISAVRAQDNRISVSINLSFIAVPKLHKTDMDYYEWLLSNSYGTDNPFAPFSGYTKSPAGPAAPGASPDSDFFMMVNSIYSDLTTIVLNKKGEKSAVTHVYADNPAVENVEFEVVQQGEKYYYHYRTQKDSYPEQFNQLVEFKPNGTNIVLEIFSTPRNDNEDRSGASITLVNKTRLKLVVKVINDDSKNPRVKFASKSGDILIK